MRRLPRSAAVIGLAVAGLVAAAVVARAAVLPDVASPATSTQQATRVNPPNYALVIGDSAISYVRWVPGASSAVIGFDRYLDLESCRRLVVESCTGRGIRDRYCRHRVQLTGSHHAKRDAVVVDSVTVGAGGVSAVVFNVASGAKYRPG